MIRKPNLFNMSKEKCNHIFNHDKVIANVFQCKYCGETRVELGDNSNDFDI